MTDTAVPGPNAKLRRVGAALLVLAVLSLSGTVAGFGAGGVGGRIVLAVVALVFGLVGFALLRTKQPAVESIRMSPHDFVITVAGSPPEHVPFGALRDVRIRRLSRGITGYLISFEFAPGMPIPTRLAPFRIGTSGSAPRIAIGLTGAQPRQLLDDLREAGPNTPWTGLEG